MFGYVGPCKMELRIRDYELFKSYYCGLCLSIKKNYGNLPRLALNYDMTFLAILLDSLEETKIQFKKGTCIIHPIKKRVFIMENSPLDYAAFCNVILTYFKLLDDVRDDHSLKSNLLSKLFKLNFDKASNRNEKNMSFIKERLEDLNKLEESCESKFIDEYSHPFADLTGYIVSSYKNDTKNETLYWLGYNLGKWIYLCDAFDDLEMDMKKNKFNPINRSLNSKSLPYHQFSQEITSRIEFTLTTCAQQCAYYLDKLELKKNSYLLNNILKFGLIEKMDKIFKGSEKCNEESL